MDYPPIILLTAPDIVEAKRVASLRQMNKEGLNSTQRFHAGETSLDGHVLGVLGELAVGRFLGADIDKKRRQEGDQGFDFEIRGITIDVQTTPYDPGFLKYDEAKHRFRADIAVMVEQVSILEYKLAGCISIDQFIERAFWKDFKHGNRLTVDPRDTRPVHALARWLLTL